ncbi:unnamed protein product [Callosobruchus maculatus]|uniref:Reverse transcriptase domain-containing protein n=1 Tax=Callosobruchus maculatus TaxID=64391 RepID=A0A653DRR7_CALMS|nr:unnamed protein product [Callosobruchus maculatus]
MLGSKISNLRFADDTTLIAASQEELVALLNVFRTTQCSIWSWY